MDELIRQLEAARNLALDTLRGMDMGSKQATIRAARMQARAEAFEQAIDWAKKKLA